MRSQNMLWVQAAVILAKDPTVKVICPESSDDFLEVLDIASPTDASLIERHMRCPTCGAHNSMRMRTDNKSDI